MEATRLWGEPEQDDSLYERVPAAAIVGVEGRPFALYTRIEGRYVKLLPGVAPLMYGDGLPRDEQSRPCVWVLRADRQKAVAWTAARLMGARTRLPEDLPQEAPGALYEAAAWAVSATLEKPSGESIRQAGDAVGQLVVSVSDDAPERRRMVARASEDASRAGHSLAVAVLGAALMRRVQGMDGDDLHKVTSAMLLHDIGFWLVPWQLLAKRGQLGADELALIRRHPRNGVTTLDREQCLTPELEIIVGRHHERPDGSGYPDGLAGVDVPETAQVTGLCDMLAAVLAPRPHRGALPLREALAVVRDEAVPSYGPALFRELVMLFA